MMADDFLYLGIDNDDWGKQNLMLQFCRQIANIQLIFWQQKMKQDLMLQNLTNLTKLNLTLQYCQLIEKGKLTASEDEAMKMQQIFG